MEQLDDYGDVHRFFLQELMAVGIMDSYGVKDTIQKCHQALNLDYPDIARFIKILQDKLKPSGFSIKKAINEDCSKKGRAKDSFYVLTVLTERTATDFPILTSKAMPDFSPKEVEYIKVIMNKVLMSDDKEISRQEALNATLEMPSHCKMSMTEAEASVDRFRARHWLRFDRDQESIHLAPRFLAEMEPYLLNLHAKAREAEYDEDDPGNGVDLCKLCHRMVIRSWECEKCNGLFHKYCRVYPDDDETKPAKCPKCSDALPIKQEKESRPSKRNQNGRSKSRTSSQKRRENENELKRKRFNRVSSSEEED